MVAGEGSGAGEHWAFHLSGAGGSQLPQIQGVGIVCPLDSLCPQHSSPLSRAVVTPTPAPTPTPVVLLMAL